MTLNRNIVNEKCLILPVNYEYSFTKLFINIETTGNQFIIDYWCQFHALHANG